MSWARTIMFAVIFIVFLSHGFGESSLCEVADVCVTDFSVDQCLATEELVENSNIFNCCPSCQTSNGDAPVVEQVCQSPSSCLPDGTYAPVQCKGDVFTGRCFCSDAEGNRIFGQMWRGQANEMTCACSRRRAELEKSGRKDVTIHCEINGDYEPLQCDSGLCWCVEPRTGQPTVTPVMEADMKRLPCYDLTKIGESYLRQCESVTYALSLINKEQSEHGTNFLGNPTTFCDYDGSYGPYQISGTGAYCTGKDGSILGVWQVVATEMAGMNCNCARDTAVYFPEVGMEVTETCQGNGNYQPNQNVGDAYYCVDKDGYPTTGYMDAWPEDSCASYA